MTDHVYLASKNIIAKNPKTEWMIAGYSGFLLLNKKGNPKAAMHTEHHFQRALKKFRKSRPA